ncbi:MAG: YdcF family protein [Oscillospiraceae bacterium]|nr:YdcF family protein [Oscillospiraceae bacterium]
MLENRRIIDDITRFIFVSDKLEPSDIIFLPGSSCPEIPEKAAQLYAGKYTPIILPSGCAGLNKKFPGVKNKKEIYDKEYATEYEFYTDVLIKNGVPDSAILCENKSTYTKENAFFSRKVTDKHNFKINSAIICCKPFHARRCLMYYQLAFPETEIKIVPVNCYTTEEIRKDNWFMNKTGIERVLGELSRCGNQFLMDDLFAEKILNSNSD